MIISRRRLLGTSAGAILAAPAIVRAQGTGSLKIGEINSYSTFPSFTLPYKNGMAMAVNEINANGGVLGRNIEVISKDDAASPQTALSVATQLLTDEQVDLLAGGFLSNVGLALSDFAAHNKKLYVAGEPLSDALVWAEGNATCFRLRPSTYVQAAMLVEAAAKLPAKRWATVAPNYAYGKSAVASFKKLLSAKRPDVVYVEDQLPDLDGIDAAAVVNALAAANPDAIFNVTFGDDLTNFVKQGNTRGLFKGREVVSMLSGEPEYLNALGAEAPVGWIVTGYPGAKLTDPANTKFFATYKSQFNSVPFMGSIVGYALIKSIAAGVTKSGGTATAAMETGFKGAKFETPFGPAYYRAIDNQSTFGTYVGKIALEDGVGVMSDFHYVNGASVLPSNAEVEKLRPSTS